MASEITGFNPLDFFLSGHLKSVVFETQRADIDDFKRLITATGKRIKRPLKRCATCCSFPFKLEQWGLNIFIGSVLLENKIVVVESFQIDTFYKFNF